jgi:D-alanyl-D-alanine dipeptidase
LDALKVVLIGRETFAIPEDALLDAPSTDGQRTTIPIDAKAFVNIDSPCIKLSGPVHPINKQLLENAANMFCDKRPEGSTWTITGDGASPPTFRTKKYIKQCLYRKECANNTPVSSMGMRSNPEALSTIDGNVVPSRADLQGYTKEQMADENSDEFKKVYDFLLPFADPAQSPHTSGLAVDIYCAGVPKMPFPNGTSNPYAPCQLFLEEIMKEAGFCRLYDESWHFESKANKMTPTKCLDEFSIGIMKKGSTYLDYNNCDGQFLLDGGGKCLPVQN